MGVSENIKLLRSRFELTQDELGKIEGVSGKAVHTWETGSREPRMGAIQKIADHFGLSKSALIEDDGILHAFSNNVSDSENSNRVLTSKDERDIANDLKNIMEKLSNEEAGPASFDGEDIPEADREMFAAQVEIMLKRLKLINKELYNPNKNKK